MSDSEAGLDGNTSEAGNFVISLQKSEGIVKPLLAHLTHDFRRRGKDNSSQSKYVAWSDGKAGVHDVHADGWVEGLTGTDIGFTTEWIDGNRIFVQNDHIICEASIHVGYAVKFRGKYSRESGNEAGT